MPRKLALLVGVDRYPLVSQLRSCINDVRLMARVLQQRFGFAEEDMAVLLDEAATREGILAGLDQLKARARTGDSVVFYYSGHGSQIPDLDGDEPDGWDETLVPYDSGRAPHPNRDVDDDEIYDWVLQMSEVTPNLTVIADTCCSGTLTRRPGEKWVERDPRHIPRRRASRELPEASARRRRDTGPSGFLRLGDRYVLLAACRASEAAKELPPIPGKREPFSAFTFFLCQELLRAPARATYRDVIERTRVAVAAAVTAQTPQVEGARDRWLFGATTLKPEPYLPIEAREGHTVRLGGGTVHGVGPGAQWRIYPPGTSKVEGVRAIGTVVVRKVRGVSADAEILREQKPITVGARAFEWKKGPGWMRLGVSIETGELGRSAAIELARRIERSKLLSLEEVKQAEIRIRVQEPVRPADTEAAPVLETSWIALGRSGELLLPPIPLQAGSVARLVADLETRARYLNLLRIENEDEASSLPGRLEVHLLRRSGDETFVRARPEKATGEIAFQEGEHLAFRIRHRSDQPLHIHILSLGLSGGISLIYPVAGANEPLAAGGTLDIGVRRGQRIKVRIPETFRALATATGGRVEGREFVKVFATTEEADLSWLGQPGFGGASQGRPMRGGLGSLLWNAVGGSARTDSLPTQEERWVVVTRSFLVREAVG